jgi:hypothetical protein
MNPGSPKTYKEKKPFLLIRIQSLNGRPAKTATKQIRQLPIADMERDFSSCMAELPTAEM